MKLFTFFIATLFSLISIGQTTTNLSKVEIVGNKLQILRVTEEQETESIGKLTTGETVRAGCYDGDCYFRIDYKDRIIQTAIDPSSLFEAYEFDFGGDGDKELILIEYSEYSPNIMVVSYSKGNSSLMLHDEISSNKTLIRQNYIECFDETGLPTNVWHYYKGVFWEMVPVSTH